MLVRLEASSRSNNARAGLTGFLFYQGSKFYGLLEGPRELLLERMEVIVSDRRHCHLTVLREEDVESCRFRNWTFSALPLPSPSQLADPVSDAFIMTLARRLS